MEFNRQRDCDCNSKWHAKCCLGFSNYKCFDEAKIRGYVWTDKFNVGALIRPSKKYNRSNVIRLYAYVYTCVEQQIRGHRGISGSSIW